MFTFDCRAQLWLHAHQLKGLAVPCNHTDCRAQSCSRHPNISFTQQTIQSLCACARQLCQNCHCYNLFTLKNGWPSANCVICAQTLGNQCYLTNTDATPKNSLYIALAQVAELGAQGPLCCSMGSLLRSGAILHCPYFCCARPHQCKPLPLVPAKYFWCTCLAAVCNICRSLCLSAAMCGY